MVEQQPLLYLVAVDPGFYDAILPVYVAHDDPASLQFTLTAYQLAMAFASDTANPLRTALRREYTTRTVLQRLHQQRFRRMVLAAYREQCCMCHLRHVELLAKFTNLIDNDYPDHDLDDLMAGVDNVIAKGYIDTKNLFVYGCSGGGVLTAWTVGHTDRFAAAVVQCPVIDWISFVGVTDGAGWYGNFAKPFWEDPSEYLKRSPIMYVGNVKTPTMLMTGVLDLRTPIPQTEEFYRSLNCAAFPRRCCA